MTTRYSHTLVVVTPEADWPIMNELAVQFGESGEPNRNTFTTVRLQRDDTGYACINTVTTDAIPAAIYSSPELLPEGCLVLMGSFDPESPPAYDGQTIIAVDVPLQTVLATFGFEDIDDADL